MKGVRQLADATCLGCGCLCDDITLGIEDNRIVKAERACPIGERWFLADRPAGVPACKLDGAAASLEAGYARASQILRGARHPLFVGLAGLTCESQRLAVALADQLGGRIDLDRGTAALDAAVQAVGMVTATLGEVRHRSDLVIFWGVDPATTHPRHFERYSLEPRGEFVPNGRADRTCIVIDSRRTATANVSDLFLQVKAGVDGAIIEILQALWGGAGALDAADVEARTGAALEMWRDVIGRIRAARYGAVFFDAHSSSSEALLTFVRDVNRHTRLVALTLGTAGNEAGAKQLLMWQTGRSGSVDFANDTGRQRDDEVAPDAALVFACDPMTDAISTLPTGVCDHLMTIQRVVVHTSDVAPPAAAVAFAVATPGIHAGGTVFRCDGVPLPLRGAVEPAYPTVNTVLESIARGGFATGE